MSVDNLEGNVVKLAKDEEELARMGYKQELKRDLGLLQNFGMSFSIISVMTGIPSLFAYGLNTGGPAVMVWAWVVVSFFTMAVGLAMAEICSAHPTSGGPYYWAAMLSEKRNAPLASWITGWFNLLGQVAVTTGISFGCATFISTAATLGTSFEPNAKTNIGVYAAVLFSQGLINTFGVSTLHQLNNISVFWHALGSVAVIAAVLGKAPTHQSASFVFKQFLDGTGVDGVGWGERASHVYVVVVGILMAQASVLDPQAIYGTLTVAVMTEETRDAAMSGSIGIIMAIGVSAVLGWFIILGFLFSIQDLDATLNSSTGLPVTQIFLDTVGEKGAIGLMVVVIGCMYFCGTFSITSNSRMMYAFARDGGIPGHKFFNYVSPQWKSPTRTVWLACALSFILGLPSLGSTVAYSAATSIATIGLYISYGIPIMLRVIYREKFVRGPFHPQSILVPRRRHRHCVDRIHFNRLHPSPSQQTLNYAIVAVGIVIIYSVGFWFISARKWFTGPVRQIEAMESTGSDTEKVMKDDV
ncbi:APC amino acid permease [Coprinopsis sp. MPI-PUGE-AT-0042]|nr:APC amino acid permease [Coprinopsis sp. MPI-PUGE-AT-0042]